MQIPRGSTAPIPFHFNLASDHLTGATGKAGLAIVKLSANGTAFVLGTGVVTETGGGDYEYHPAAGETSIEGALLLHVEATGCDKVDDLHTTAADYIVYRQTRPIPFFLVDSATHLLGVPSLSPVVTIAIAGGAFNLPGGTVSEVGGTGNGFGWYLLTPTATDTGTVGTFALHAVAATADTVDDLYAITNPQVLWGAADLLARCKLHARRPAVDQAMPDTAWYAFLTEAQPTVYADLFSRYPDLGFSAPERMTTLDGGLTYQFGSQLQEFPMGYATIYPDLRSVPDSPLQADTDFLMEGTQIRMLANQPRTFASGPYARYVLSPSAVIDATTEPLLRPASARMLLVWKALEDWASRPGSGASPGYYAGKYADALDRTLLAFASAYNQHTGDTSKWWTRADLGASGFRGSNTSP